MRLACISEKKMTEPLLIAAIAVAVIAMVIFFIQANRAKKQTTKAQQEAYQARQKIDKL